MTRDYMQSNRGIWDQWAIAHAKSEFYDLEAFRAGKSSLHAIELEALGNVAGKYFCICNATWERIPFQERDWVRRPRG